MVETCERERLEQEAAEAEALAEVEAILADVPAPPPPEIPPGDTDAEQVAADNDLVTRYAGAKRRIEAELATVKDNYQAIVGHLSRRLDNLEKFRGALAEHAVRRLTAGKKAKSVKTFHGLLGLRTNPAKLVVEDEAAAMAADPEFVKVEERRTLVKSALNDHLQNTGELPPGCRLEPAREVLYLRK